MTKEKEQVNNPEHYGTGKDDPYEVIKIIEAWGLDFKEGNVLKYLLRYKSKNGLVDLKKSQWYLERKINQLEKLEKPLTK